MKANKYRTHKCGEVTEVEVQTKIKVAGWIESIRDHGGLIFLDLRDETGIIQLVSNDDKIFDGLTKESTISVEGILRKRKEVDYNLKHKTGTIEVVVETLELLSKALNTLPFDIMTSHETNEELRLKYRYLDLRNPKIHENIIFRSQVIDFLRSKMKELNFLEIQTPILTASSPEGARDYIIPSRKHHGKFYALPQAPQIFKQLLMVSSFDRYFQIAPCFRDEDARADRAPGEFYQLDIEMAFAEAEDVYEVVEEVLFDTFKKFSTKEISPRPFRRISYKESMLKYGTDKPDLRNPLEIIDLSEEFKNTEFAPFRANVIRGIKVENIADKPNSWFNEIGEFASSIGMPGIGYVKINEDMTFTGPIAKFLKEEEVQAIITKANLKPQSVLFFIGDKTKAAEYAGKIRIELGRKLNLIDDNKFDFCFIEDFPMFEYNKEEDKYDFTHNPFSMPKGGAKALETENLEDIVAYQYDIVCNGIELSSGAVRNHDRELLKKTFAIVGYSEEVLQTKFKSIYTAFQYGTPPHAGIAPGVDRMIMLLKDQPNLREIIAFPMNSNAQDLMMGSPSEISEQQLKDVHIKVR